MQVYEVSLQIYFIGPVPYERASERIGRFIDIALKSALKNISFYADKNFKSYTFDLPYPPESEHVYKERKIYTIRIRTVKKELAEYFETCLPLYGAAGVQGLSGELRQIPRLCLESVYTLTPVIMKTGQGYWRKRLRFQEYENRLKNNLVNKYNVIHHSEISGDFPLYQYLEFKNRKPVKVPYRDIVLLGDKVSLTASENELAQELLYMALGTGLGENNASGCGFLNYRFRQAEDRCYTKAKPQ